MRVSATENVRCLRCVLGNALRDELLGMELLEVGDDRVNDVIEGIIEPVLNPLVIALLRFGLHRH